MECGSRIQMMLHIPPEWLWPYIASNLTAIALLLIAWKRPVVAKWLFAAMFLGACYANTTLVLREPSQYLNYDQFLLLGIYHTFITGFFSEHIQLIVLAIAFGQLVIGLLLCGKGTVARLGCLGAAVFLTAIIPLGVGSAFPFSLICIWALYLIEGSLRRANDQPKARTGSNQAVVH